MILHKIMIFFLKIAINQLISFTQVLKMLVCLVVHNISIFLGYSMLNEFWVEYSPMVRETKVQSQVRSYQRLKKRYLIPPYLTLSIIRYGSKVKWSNPGNEVAPSPTRQCCSYQNRAFGSPSTMVATFFTYIYIYINSWVNNLSITSC